MPYGIGFNLSTTHNEVISLADKGQALYCTGLVYGTDYSPALALG
jgi:TonB-dependent starch-binding outer membrane protein SusC